MAVSAAQVSGLRIKRVQANIVARRERQLLTWLCARLPTAVTPDRLTATGVVGALTVFGGYVASRFEIGFLWLAALGFVIHWFGDSLDGSLARYRRIERPAYGYFLDHTVDALCNLLIMAGLGFTAEVRMDVALFTLIGYYLLCMYVFINNHLSGVLRLSFLGFGPTELRLCLIGLTAAMFFFGHVGATVGGRFLSVYDMLLLFTGSVFTAIFITRVIAGIRELRDPARSGAAPAPQSPPTNLSSASK